MFAAVSFASGTTAPDGSTTVPRILAKRLSACAGGNKTTPNSNENTSENITQLIRPCFMEISLSKQRHATLGPMMISSFCGYLHQDGLFAHMNLCRMAMLAHSIIPGANNN